MTVNIDQNLASLKPPHVLEAAILTLPQVLEVDDPQEGLEKVLAGLPADERAEVDALIRRASDESSDEAVELMRAVMGAAADEKRISDEAMSEALDAVGRKQLVITPDLYLLGLTLTVGYLAVVTKGRSSVTTKTTIKQDKDGRWIVTIDRKEVFLNPFSPLLKLIQRVLGMKETGS
jgi:hypothetical protein